MSLAFYHVTPVLSRATHHVFVLPPPQDHKEDVDKRRKDAESWQPQQAAAKVARINPDATGGGGSAKDPGSTGAAATDDTKKIKLPKKLDLSAGKGFRPPHTSLWHETTSGRIRVSYTNADRKQTWSWPAAPYLHGALIRCLKWAWNHHTDATQAVSPWPELREAPK